MSEFVGFSPAIDQTILLAIDFDGTTHDTLNEQAGIMNVDQVYVLAITKVLGQEAATAFASAGGSLNRSSLEITASLSPNSSRPTIRSAADEITKQKLAILLNQIGTVLPDGQTWPPTVAGFEAAWQAINDGRRRPVTAIISAGYTNFIQACFEESGLPQPDCIVSSDTIESMALNLPLHRLSKPDSLFMRLAMTSLQSSVDCPIERTIFVGNDTFSDGQLAKNTGSEFVLIKTTENPSGWEKVVDILGRSSPRSLAGSR
jgi:FMN phosphatase YigB (HAD superfamily)